MGMSAAQQFLVEATRSAGRTDYFRWQSVGLAIGFSPAQSDNALKSLGERKLIILLSEGNARLLDAGRQLAARLEAKAPGRESNDDGRSMPTGTRSKVK